MAAKRTHIWLILIGVAVSLPLLVFLGVRAFVFATATPLHPDPAAISAASAAEPPPAWRPAVDAGRQIVRADIAAQNLPAVSVAVAAGGELVWVEAFGWADLEHRTPVSPRMRFRVGTTAQVLTSAAVGLLVQDGRLKLDDEIHTYVPAYPKKQWPVTLRHLMADQAGLADAQEDYRPPEECIRTIEGLELMGFWTDPLGFEPGTRHQRSAFGWMLVSAAVEAVAHDPFSTVMKTQVFEPLRLSDIRLDGSMEPGPDQATFYYPRYGADTRYGPQTIDPVDYSCFAGAGGFLSTPSDLARFGAAFIGGKWLQPDTVKTLLTPQRLKTGDATSVGLGWRLDTLNVAGQSTAVAAHHGISFGGTTSLLTLPDRGIVVAVMTNTSFADTRSLAAKIAETFAAAGKQP